MNTPFPEVDEANDEEFFRQDLMMIHVNPAPFETITNDQPNSSVHLQAPSASDHPSLMLQMHEQNIGVTESGATVSYH